MDDAIKAELAVQELMLTLLLNDLRHRHPELLAGIAEKLQTLSHLAATPAGSAVLQKWSARLAP